MSARACVSPHVAVLRACGFMRAEGLRLHAVYCGFVLAVTMAYLAQECVHAYQVQRDMAALARVMFLLLCHVTSLAKQIALQLRALDLRALLDTLDEPLFNSRRPCHVRLLRDTAAGALRLERAYAGCAALTCLLWITFPLAAHARAQRVQFPFWVGLDYNLTHVAFYLVLAYSYYVTTLVAIANTTMDAFVATILKQCKTQLRIMRMNLEKLPERATGLAQGRGELAYRAALRELFLDCLKHYEKITHVTCMLQDIFGSAILIQFAIGGWILCMAAYQIVSLQVLSVEFASMAMFLVCILTELFLYCYYGNEVRDESARVAQSAYGMRWTALPLCERRALVLVLARAQRPLQLAAGRVVPLSLHTFVQIIKSSYTFYAVLRQTK